MTDILTPEERSLRMSLIRSRGTEVERVLGIALWTSGLRYRKNDRSITGKPDFCFRGAKVAVFCDSEFWHGKNWSRAKRRFKTNPEYWTAKIERNIKRDKYVNRQLMKDGWLVMRFWSKQIQENLADIVKAIKQAVERRRAVSRLKRRAV